MVPQPRLLALVAALTVVIGGCQAAPSSEGSMSPNPSASVVPDAASLTAYDPTASLELTEASVETLNNGTTVHDISWASATGARATAWLVVPPGSGPFAGLVYLHGSETDRNDFLDEAVAMASGGAVSVVLDAPFARTGADRRAYLQSYGGPERERDMTAQTVIDLRRAYDLLSARADVDPARLGYIGHSWGASLGAVLASVDARPIALVLICPRPSWTGFLATSTAGWVSSAKTLVGEDRWNAYLTAMAPLDALAVIDAINGERLELQYGTADEVVPPEVAQQLVDAAPGATVAWFEAGHALDDAATADRVGWLVERLGLDAITAETLAGVGLPDE
jgi:cephalosporin-C deacetylase-like acetyl esterase